MEVEIKHIKELMAVMSRTGTKRLTLKKENFELSIEKEESMGRFTESQDPSEDNLKHSLMWNRFHPTFSDSEMLAGKSSAPLNTENGKEEDVNSLYVTSQMVGTFYSSPSPEHASFVKVGDRIEKNTVVCIIEAMKVMNEIKANISGTIVEVLVETGQPVEFGTKLFRIVE